MAISEDTINRVCNTASPPDLIDPSVNAVELAMEYSIQEGDISEAEDQPGQKSTAQSAPDSLSNSPSNSSLHLQLSLKGKEKAVEDDQEEEGENDDNDDEADEADKADKADEADEADEQEEDRENNNEEKDTHPNAREPANDAVRTLEAQVLEHQSHRRDVMQKKYNASHRVVIFKEGDYASMAIPKEDRVPTDNLRMIVKIIKAPHQNRYRVQSRYGIIKGLISITSLNVVTEQHIADLAQQFENASKKEVLLSRAAAQASNTDRIALSCNCKRSARSVVYVSKIARLVHSTVIRAILTAAICRTRFLSLLRRIQFHELIILVL